MSGAGRHVALAAIATAAALVGAPAAPARAQLVAHTAPTAAELEGWASQLGSDDERIRLTAFGALTSLDEDALPAIDARLTVLERRRLDREQAGDMVTDFRHAAGSRRADDDVDIAPGVLVVLRERRDPMVMAMAEPLLLMRSLERIGSVVAIRRIGEICAIDGGLWIPEGRRAVMRLGSRAIPALIESKLSEHTAARAWGRWGLRQLPTSAPGMLVQNRDSALLADILRAWGKVLDMDAMRVVISYVGSDRTEVRDAARWTMERYGRNAVWQLRQAYENITGGEAVAAWSWRRLMNEVFRAYDATRLVDVGRWLDEGLAALRAGDLGKMRDRFDRVLLRAPHHDRRAEMAPGYAALGRARLQRDDLKGAAAALSRAVRLAPSHAQANAWRADVAFIEGERSLARGVVDLAAYRRALTKTADHVRATDAIATLTGERAAHERKLRTWISIGAALALALAGILLLGRRRRPVGPVDAPTTLPDARAPGGEEATLAGG